MQKEKWWDLVNKNWKSILEFCEEYLPMDSTQDYDGNSTTRTVRQHILLAFSSKDPVLARYLNEAWWNSPENGTGEIWQLLNTIFMEEPQWETEHALDW